MAGTPKRRRHKTYRPPLTAPDIRFCQRYFETGKRYESFVAEFGTRETRRATDQAAYCLVKKREIREFLRHLQDVAAKTASLTAEEIAAGIANTARADRRKLFDSRTGRPLMPHQWTPDVEAVVDGVEFEETRGKRKTLRVKKLKLSPRLPAWVKLAEWKRMLGQDKADAGKGGHEPLVVGGDARVENL